MKTQLAALMRIALFALIAALPSQAAAQTQLPVDPAEDIVDLVGILAYDSSSRRGTLHVLPSEEQKVLEVLGAYPVEDRKFLVNARGPILVASINYDLFDLVEGDEQIRVYVNRMCTEIAPPQFHFCQPNSSGQYTTLVQLPDRACRRNSFSKGMHCTEHRRTWSTRDVWEDDQCTIPLETQVTKRLTCG